MDHYFDIRIRPDPEFGPEQLMSALFSKLHRVLAECDSHDIGVSFPEVEPKRPTLGGHLRLHGESPALQRLMATNWLAGMRDHIHLGEIQAIPSRVSHRAVTRVQAKSNADRIRRRQMRRHGLSELEVQERIPDFVETHLTLPFVSIRSRSTKQTFRLFIEHGASKDVAQPGLFNFYGLGNGATIPWF
jgi:CRISPR-associated endonuclease Csy4